MEEPKPVLCL